MHKMLQLQFGINSMYCIHGPNLSRVNNSGCCWWWCNSLEKVLLALCHLIPINHRLAISTYLSTVANYALLLWPLLTLEWLLPAWSTTHLNLLPWTSQWVVYINGLNRNDHLCDMVGQEICSVNVQLTHVQQFCDAVMLTWTFQHPAKSMIRRI